MRFGDQGEQHVARRVLDLTAMLVNSRRSLRKVIAAMTAYRGHTPSAGKALDEMADWRSRPLEHVYALIGAPQVKIRDGRGVHPPTC